MISQRRRLTTPRTGWEDESTDGQVRSIGSTGRHSCGATSASTIRVEHGPERSGCFT
jgi:hypothetical protein